MQTNNNSIDATKRTGVDAKNAAYTSANTVLPYWDNNEINKRLEEHTKLLTEWEELLNKTGNVLHISLGFSRPLPLVLVIL